MRNLKLTMLVLVLSASISFGTIEFDHIISDFWVNEIVLFGQESLLVAGSGADRIYAPSSNYIEVRNTSPLQPEAGGINELILNGNSKMNYYGGETNTLKLLRHSSAVLQGGSINYLTTTLYTGTTIGGVEIICKSYNYDADTNLLTGTWIDDSTFSIQLIDDEYEPPTINDITFTVIPEPATLMMLGSGSLLLFKRKKS